MSKKWTVSIIVLMIVIFTGCQGSENEKVDTIIEEENESTEKEAEEDFIEGKIEEEAKATDTEKEEIEAKDEKESSVNSDRQDVDIQNEVYEIFQDDASGKYGYKAGEKIFEEYMFDEVDVFIDGYAVVKNNDKSFVIDKTFNIILENEIGIENFGFGYFGLTQEFEYNPPNFNKYRLVNSQGTELLASDVFEVDVFNEDLILVGNHLKGWLIDKEGRPVGSKNSKAFEGYSYAEVADGNFLLYRNEGDEKEFKKVDSYGVLIAQNDISDHSVVLGDGISVSDYIPFFGRFEKVKLPKISSDKNTFDTANAYFASLYNADEYRSSDVSSVYGTKEIEYEVQRVGNILEIDIIYYEYGFGAVHPYYYLETYLLSTSTGNPYRLSDMLAAEDGYNQISELVREKIQDTELGQSLLVDISEVKVETNTQFRVSKEGITFYYALYEIAPYAGGMPEIFVSWDELDDLIDKTSIFYVEIMK